MSHALGEGGGERQLALTALNMDRARFEPHVGSCDGGFWTKRLEAAGIPRYVMGPRSLIGVSALREALRLRRYIGQNEFDIVQSFDFTMNVLAIPVARSVPGVTTVANLRCHTSLIPRRYRWLNRMAHRMSAGIVVNSEELRRHLADDFSIPATKIFTCHNGLDTDTFHPGPRPAIRGIGPEHLVIGTVCVLRPEKNIGLLLEAFERVSRTRPRLRLLIVGTGPEEASLRACASRLNLGEKCIFHPSTAEVARILPAIDVFVLPSLNEGLSNALMEAMACGCCVVASAVGGNPELVLDGVTGLLFRSQDVNGLAGKLSEAIDNPEKRNFLATAAAKRMVEDFSLKRSVTCMQQVYESVLSAR